MECIPPAITQAGYALSQVNKLIETFVVPQAPDKQEAPSVSTFSDCLLDRVSAENLLDKVRGFCAFNSSLSLILSR